MHTNNKQRKQYILPVVIVLAVILLVMTGSFCYYFLAVNAVPYEDLISEEQRLSADLPSPDDTGMADTLCVLAPDASVIPDGWDTYYSAGVFDLSGKQVLYGSNVFEELQPASVTKILTAYTALKYGNLDDVVTVSENALITEDGAKLCGFVPGDRLTLRQALYGLLVYSGNDAAVVVAEHIGGTVEHFCDMMNAEARSLGATHTHFVNPHGLTAEGHHTTAYDLYLIFDAVTDYDIFRQIIGTRSYTCDFTGADGAPRSLTWNSTNKFFTGEAPLEANVTVLGAKTGYTAAAGACLIVLAQDGLGNEYIAVTLRSADRNIMYTDMSRLLRTIDNKAP